MINRWIYSQLKRLGLTVDDLAERMGVSPGIVRDWVSGKHAPTWEELARLTDWLGDPFHPPGILMVVDHEPPMPGTFVKVRRSSRGVGKLHRLAGGLASVLYFQGPGVNDKVVVPSADVQRVRISPQTRCYIKSDEHNIWLVGRIGNYDHATGHYEVHWPSRHSEYIAESDLFVRSADPQVPASELLVARAHETAFFHTYRFPLIAASTSHRALTHGLAGMVSARIQLYQHQVEVVRRVTSDPVQRYLLADEVGLGKTIEACAIARQHLLDNPEGHVLILTPEGLVHQWQEEWDQRFAIYPYDPRIEILRHEYVAKRSKDPTLLIVDEAHHIAAGAWYRGESHDLFVSVKRLAHQAAGVLLLSATPAATHADEFLAMLHMLDPDLYRLEDRDAFSERVALQPRIGEILLGLGENTPSFLLKSQVRKLQDLLRDDEEVHEKAQTVLDLFQQDASPEEYLPALRALKTHVSEGYRLYHRLLRSRRTQVQATTFGRSRERLKEEWGIDEREREVLDLLEQWRLAALGAGAAVDPYARLYRLFLELAWSDLSLLGASINARLHGGSVPGDLETHDKKLLQLPLFDDEATWLEAIIRAVSEPVAPGDMDRPALLVEACRQALDHGEKVVVFASYPSVAKKLAEKLTKTFSEACVFRRLASMHHERQHREVQWFREKRDGAILLVDRSSEEGVNLQMADRIILFDVPFAPNRLEQRLGRVDRLGRTKPLHISVFLGPESETPTPYEAWISVLRDGLGFFDGSIASLQFLVDDLVSEVVATLYQGGPIALEGKVDEVKQRVEEHYRQILRQDALNSLETRTDEADRFFDVILESEKKVDQLERSLHDWLTTVLRFRVKCQEKGAIYLPTEHTLIPTDIVLNRYLPLVNRPITFAREAALNASKVELVRLGHPLLDHTLDYLRWDDRGRAYAFHRHAPELQVLNCPPWWGFRMDWMIEADIAPVLSVLDEQGIKGASVKASVRRKADALLRPRVVTVFVSTDGDVVEDPVLLRLLEAPFRRKRDGGRDINLTKERAALIEEYVAAHRWPDTVREATRRAEEFLAGSDETRHILSEAVDRLERARIKSLETLRLRVQRGLLPAEHLEHEEAFWEAMSRGIQKPTYWLDAAGFIVLDTEELEKLKTDD
ncbi:MAG: hypothetical protein KatS3mg015_2421 [Fimbriimonadales bacterium]|nr:MAG: hypothetical protein KatS3mg015_2421 [Fimbriimonadales bacterium]